MYVEKCKLFWTFKNCVVICVSVSSLHCFRIISKINTKHLLVNIYKRNFESSERIEQWKNEFLL